MMRATYPVVTLLPLLVAWGTGCEATVTKDKFDRLNQTWLDTQRTNRDLTRRNQELEETIGHQNDQIAELQKLGDKRLDKLFYVADLELGRRCGGVDKDNKPGDEGVIVYFQPVDRDGHVIKAAGEATVQLYDLANPPAQNLIGEYHWSVDELGSTWAGGFLGSSQFSLLCPCAGPPAHEQITIRATFVDYLTGKTFTATKTVPVRLPPSAERRRGEPSASAPASTAPASQPTSEPTSGQAN